MLPTIRMRIGRLPGNGRRSSIPKPFLEPSVRYHSVVQVALEARMWTSLFSVFPASVGNDWHGLIRQGKFQSHDQSTFRCPPPSGATSPSSPDPLIPLYHPKNPESGYTIRWIAKTSCKCGIVFWEALPAAKSFCRGYNSWRNIPGAKESGSETVCQFMLFFSSCSG